MNKAGDIRQFGLIGYPLSHSFSPSYFKSKFEREGITDAHYGLFPLEHIEEFPNLLIDNPQICGLNVTIPYKQEIIPYLLRLDEAAASIGAVNTIRFTGTGLIGYNTDWLGFTETIKPHLKEWHTKALVLGTGGSSKAVHYGLQQLGLETAAVSRTIREGVLFSYESISPEVIEEYTVIVNTTPLGMAPDRLSRPELPYHILTEKHLLYDLVYNPEKTVFLMKGDKAGAAIKSGTDMLHVQAERAWDIWNLPLENS